MVFEDILGFNKKPFDKEVVTAARNKASQEQIVIINGAVNSLQVDLVTYSELYDECNECLRGLTDDKVTLQVQMKYLESLEGDHTEKIESIEGKLARLEAEIPGVTVSLALAALPARLHSALYPTTHPSLIRMYP